MSDDELQRLVERISIERFDCEFKHMAYFNRRLKTTGGRYHLGSHNIDINPKIIELYDHLELERVIIHELCHYHLHIANRGYRHRDRDFKQLLAKTGGARYCQSLNINPQTKHLYICTQCGTKFPRQRKINTDVYVCGKCHAPLMKAWVKQ